MPNPINTFFHSLYKSMDWFLILAMLPIFGAGLVTMASFTGAPGFFDKQIIWIVVSLIVLVGVSFLDVRFLRRTSVLVVLYIVSCVALLALFVLGHASHGARSWVNLGFFSIQPSDPLKIILILMLAKYFSKRHIEIANIQHIIVSGIYALVPFVLVALHPDFGSAITIFAIWFGMVLVSGISKKHLAIVFCVGLLVTGVLWNFGFKDYQKQRILNFIHPLSNIQGSGYNAYQATVTVGSGQIIGKGIGYGTQSRLKFLPEYQTDFIFAAFAEEWGFVGVMLLIILFAVVIQRILSNAMKGETNFEILFGVGLAIFFMTHLIINIGMNIGIVPVTGIPVPFMSYGGSHLVTECLGIGILMSMKRYSRGTHKDVIKNDFAPI